MKGRGGKFRYHQNKKTKYHQLEKGVKGFLCTCNFQEKNCVREAYNLLEEYADKLYGTTAEQQFEDTCDTEEADPSDLLKKQIDDLKNKGTAEKRFQNLSTGVDNCVFIETKLDDPVQLVHHIVKDIAETKVQKTRFLLRLIPIEASCTIKLNDIIDTADKLFDKYFLTAEPTSFCIVFNKRYSNCSKDVIIKELAELVVSKNSEHKVNLMNPNLFVIVEIVKGICLLSVISDYYRLKKFNLIELCAKPGEKSDANFDNKETEDYEVDKNTENREVTDIENCEVNQITESSN